MLWLTLAWADPSEADPSEADLDRAMELFDNGEELYAEGRYEDAIAAWQKSYDLSGREALLFNLANAQERLGRYEEAIASLNRYRAFGSAREREQLDQRVRNLERLAERQRQERAPEPQVAPQPEPVEPEPVEPIPVEPEPVVEPVPVETEPVVEKRKSPGRTAAAATLFTVGGAAWLGAVGTGLAFGASQARVSELCVNLEQGLTCPVEAEDAIRKQTTFAYGTDVLIVVGAVAVGVGAGLAFGKRAEVTVGVGSVGLRGRF